MALRLRAQGVRMLREVPSGGAKYARKGGARRLPHTIAIPRPLGDNRTLVLNSKHVLNS